MVDISEQEFKEYMHLKQKEEERKREIDEMIKEGIESVTKWRQDLNTTRGYASAFVKILYNEWEKRGNPEFFVLDRWSRVKEYLPDFLLERKNGKWFLKQYFRQLIREYGFWTKINRKYGIFEIRRVV